MQQHLSHFVFRGNFVIMEFAIRVFPSTSTRKECNRVIIKEFVLRGFPYVLRGFLYVLRGFPYVLRGFLYVLRGFPCTSISSVYMQHGYWNHFIFSTDFILKEFVLRGFPCTQGTCTCSMGTGITSSLAQVSS